MPGIRHGGFALNDTGKSVPAQALTVLMALIFMAYLAVLIKITLIKGTSIPHLVRNLLAGRILHRSLNLVPFQTIFDYLHYRQNMSFLRWFANIFGNMLIFLPLGLYLPLVFQRMRAFSKSLFTVVVVSISLEVLQYLFGTGSTDVDDLLLNTVGGSVGYCLFLLVTRIARRREAALSCALALSFCFALAGYAVAYREFGLYLGLATLREEVQGGEQIPSRAPDAVGTVSEARGSLLILAGVSRPSIAKTLSADGSAGPGKAPGEIEVQVGPETRFFIVQAMLQGHKMVTRYEPYTPPTAATVPKNVFARVWGRWDSGRISAEVVCTTPAPKAEGTASIISVQKQPAGTALPADRPSLKGHIKGIIGDDVALNKIAVSQDGSKMFAVTTMIEERFRLTPETVFYKRRILQGGREVSIFASSRNDLVTRAAVDVWGRRKDGVLEA
jgi:glycopeptide antibiotics resistance protein